MPDCTGHMAFEVGSCFRLEVFVHMGGWDGDLVNRLFEGRPLTLQCSPRPPAD